MGFYDERHAGIAQLVERQLPKLNVVGSSPIARSIFFCISSLAVQQSAIISDDFFTFACNYYHLLKKSRTRSTPRLSDQAVGV